MADSSDEFLDLISDDHFVKIEVELKIKNTTTSTEFKPAPPTRIIEITEHGFVLEIPERSCAGNHNLVIEAHATAPQRKDVNLIVTAKVEDVEPGKNGTDRISLSLVQVQEEEWERFRKLFSSRQDEIDRFMTAARGY
jgi:hypothetical protein